jgi:outer membrane immunogenic protein
MLKWGKLTGRGSVFDLGKTMRNALLLRRVVTSTAVGFCALFCSAAIAADMGGRESIKNAPVPGASRWAGFYVGGQIGHGRAFYEGVFDSSEEDPEFRAFASDLDLSGVVGGIHVGYNLQKGNWVLGIEGDFNWADWQDKVSDAAGTGFVTGNVDWLATVRGRLGIAADRILLYATVGMVFTNAEYTAVNGATPGVASVSELGFNPSP